VEIKPGCKHNTFKFESFFNRVLKTKSPCINTEAFTKGVQPLGFALQRTVTHRNRKWTIIRPDYESCFGMDPTPPEQDFTFLSTFLTNCCCHRYTSLYLAVWFGAAFPGDKKNCFHPYRRFYMPFYYVGILLKHCINVITN
jgi:hypothetical protein